MNICNSMNNLTWLIENKIKLWRRHRSFKLRYSVEIRKLELFAGSEFLMSLYKYTDIGTSDNIQKWTERGRIILTLLQWLCGSSWVADSILIACASHLIHKSFCNHLESLCVCFLKATRYNSKEYEN